MKNDPEHDRLLDDVLDERAPAVRAQMLDRTLAQVRRQGRVRRLNRGLLAVACVVAGGLLFFREHERAPVIAKPVMATREPKPGMLRMVSSQPLAPALVVDSAPVFAPTVIAEVSNVSIIRTATAKHDFRVLTDDELLALAQGRPAVLVRQGPHQAELLFVDDGANVVVPGETH